MKMNYCMKKNKKFLIPLLSVLSLILAAIILLTVITLSDDYLPSLNGSQSVVSQKSIVDLGSGLKLTSIGNYTGLFFEDGSDDVVTGNMMVVLLNDSDKDLQLARINIHYDDFIAEFEATNIPSGKSVVLLEKNRKAYTADDYVSVSANNVVFFDSPMDTRSVLVNVTGGDGYFDVENISDEDITGATYVYYKNIAGDVLYGGITYRAVVEETIPKGKTVKVLTQHFTSDNTEVMQVLNVN